MNLESIFLGWLLGMLSPIIVTRILRKYSRNDLKRGIIGELEGIQARIACVAYILGSRFGTFNKNEVKWCIEKLRLRKSEHKQLIEGLEKVIEVDDQAFEAYINSQRSDDLTGQSLKRYVLSFSELHLLDLSLLPIEFQMEIHELRSLISIYNDEVEKAEKLLLMTFDSGISDANHKILKQSLKNKYAILQANAKKIVEQIDKVRSL